MTPTRRTPLAIAIRLAVGLAVASGAAAQDRTIQASDIGVGTAGFRIDAAEAGGNLGYSAAVAGDVNGDGLDDVVISTPFADPAGVNDAGSTFVIFGKTDQAPVDLGDLTGAGFRIDGFSANDLAGHWVGGDIDVNGDGLDDIVIGALSADPGGVSNAGKTYVIFGKADDAPVDLGTLASGTGFVVTGVSAGDYSGRSVAAVGDVNGDGLGDILIGANGAGDGGPFGFAPGEAYVVFGKADSTPVDIAALGTGVGFRIDAAGPLDEVGVEVAAPGDVNGDGLDDLLIGAIRTDPGGRVDAGAAFVVFGKADGNPVDLALIDGGGGFRIEGIDAGDFLGNVGTAGDVNGDGLADLLVGARLADPFGRVDAGEAYVVFGKADSTVVTLSTLAADGNGFRIDGSGNAAQAGRGLGGGVDFNNDGLDDLLVGTSGASPGGRAGAGTANIIFGKIDTAPVDLADLGTAGVQIEGIDPGDQLGFFSASAGDVNGDDIDDIVVTAWRADPGGAADAGEAYVVFGREIPFEVPVPPPSVLASGDRFGSAVATDGGLLVVGLPSADGAAQDQGRVVVYRTEGTTLVEEAVIDVPDGFAADNFGASLALEGNRLLVGAPGTPVIPKGLTFTAMQAALFERAADGNWSLKANLQPSNGNTGDEFGAAVDLDGDTLVVGAPGDAENVASGAAYVFEFGGQTVLTPSVKIKPAGGSNGQLFGASLATDRGRLAVGAPGAQVGAAITGSVHLYDSILDNLTDNGAMTGSASGDGDAFGTSVALTGRTMVVGAPGEDGDGVDRGAAYVFDPASMVQVGRVVPAVAQDSAGFGRAVSANARSLAIGAPGLDAGAGAAYVFSVDSLALQQQATPVGGQLGLGAAVALSGDALAIGAPDSDGETGAARIQRSPVSIFRASFE